MTIGSVKRIGREIVECARALDEDTIMDIYTDGKKLNIYWDDTVIEGEQYIKVISWIRNRERIYIINTNSIRYVEVYPRDLYETKISEAIINGKQS